jgi:hypothetical protein
MLELIERFEFQVPTARVSLLLYDVSSDQDVSLQLRFSRPIANIQYRFVGRVSVNPHFMPSLMTVTGSLREFFFLQKWKPESTSHGARSVIQMREITVQGVDVLMSELKSPKKYRPTGRTIQ